MISTADVAQWYLHMFQKLIQISTPTDLIKPCKVHCSEWRRHKQDHSSTDTQILNIT